MQIEQCPSSPSTSRNLRASVLASVILSLALPAAAHHSFAPLRNDDGSDVIEIYDGTIEIYKLLNPHTALILNLVNDDGEIEDWLIEMSSLASLVREGWTDDSLHAGDEITVAILRAQAPRRGRLRAIFVHPDEDVPGRLLVAYGIRGDTPIMRRLRERLPFCGDIDGSKARSQCFSIDADALRALEAEFPGKLGFVMP